MVQLRRGYPKIGNIKKDYVKIPVEFDCNNLVSIESNLEPVYIKLNGEDGLNPMELDENRKWIVKKAKGQGHTSMSVGDIFKIGNRYWVVDNIGFKELEE
jgi:hypothetical protein